MICPYCIQGFVYKKFELEEHPDNWYEPTHTVDIKVPCEECGGMGIISCCDGLRECNE